MVFRTKNSIIEDNPLIHNLLYPQRALGNFSTKDACLMTKEESKSQNHPQNTKTAADDGTPPLARSAALIELAHLLQRTKELCAELSPELPQNGVDKLWDATVALLRADQENQRKDAKEPISRQAYGKAEAELNQENQQYLGITDIVKNMLLWKETPEERVRKHMPDKIDD